MPNQQTLLNVEGMTCAACVRRVEKALSKVEGVESAVVNFATHEASIQHNDKVSAEGLIAKLVESGYGGHLPSAETENLPGNPYALRAAISMGLAVPIIAVSMFWMHRPLEVDWMIGLLSTIVVFGPGWMFVSNAWKHAKNGSTTMDTLIAIGALSSWSYSVFAMVRGGHLYFETGAAIIAFILLGRFLEHRAKSRMNQAIRDLMQLAPAFVTRLSANGEEAHVPLSFVSVGDSLRIRPGERLPVDGVILEGESHLDESALTGEPFPVKKSPGDWVISGTLNTTGTLLYEAKRVGKDTFLAHIADAVKRAQGTRAPLQNWADKVSSIFVPFVLAVALCTLIGWGMKVNWEVGMVNAVAVLVIACPCALGLAAPIALIVGTGRGAELGILVKDGEALERAAHVHSVVFDKTGTLTVGRPVLEEVVVGQGWTENEALVIAASLEAFSEHPVAHAVTARAKELGLQFEEVSEFEAVSGQGVSGVVQGILAKVGRHSFTGSKETTGQFSLTWGGREASFTVNDSLRATSRDAIRALASMDVSCFIASGDSEQNVRFIAQEVGIAVYAADLLPEGKLEYLKELQKKGPVCMVGDGINDAPSLAQADLGIAMGSGTGVAMETAGITLNSSDLRLVSTALRLSRKTLSTIKANLGWAFGYNCVMIPLAAAGKLEPMWAAGAMALSSISVVLNSLRLKGFR